ncbi:hypothetical protein A2U01_0064764, partial [Trifolium medium]|nr:hypothetical protein [Trifolium medium]
RGESSGALLFDPEIEKTAKANRKKAKQATRLANLEQSTQVEEDFSSPNFSVEPMEEENVVPPPPPPRRTLGDYGQRNNGDTANLGFHRQTR